MTKALDSKDELLIRYLLGDLPKNEAHELEDEMVLDLELLGHMQVVEMLLIDSYIRAEMTAAERRRFEEGFLIIPDNRKKLQDARIFHDSLGVLREKKRRVPVAGQKIGWSERIAAWFGTPVPALALAALLLILSAGLTIQFVFRRPSSVTVNNAPNNVNTSVETNTNREVAGGNKNTSGREQAPPDNRADERPGGEVEPTPKPKHNGGGREIARLDVPKQSSVQVYRIEERIGYDNPDAKGGGDEGPVITIGKNRKLLKLIVELNPKSKKVYLGEECCSVDIKNLNEKDPVFKTKIKVRRVGRLNPKDILTIQVPVKDLKDGESYHIRIYDTESFDTYFTVNKKAAKN